MEVSNPEMFFSDKDLEFNFLVRPTLEFDQDYDFGCDIAPLQHDITSDDDDEHHELHHKKIKDQPQEQDQKEEEDEYKFLVSTLEIKLPNQREFKIGIQKKEDIIEDEEKDGFKTPTSLDHKIPQVFQCPPAPTKPKPLPSSPPSTNRKLPRRGRRVLLDLSNEIKSLFPPILLSDFDKKIKKVRQEN